MAKPDLRLVPGGQDSVKDDDQLSTDGGSPEDSPASGDLGALFDAHAAYVGSVALRLVGRRHEVDDVVQEVFIAAHRGLRDTSDTRAVRRWLARVTVRVSRRRLRRLRAKGFFGVGDDAHFEGLADRAATPEQKALVGRVYEILDAMSASHRIAWVLRHVEGYRLEEVAELSECSLATAKRRIAAAQDTLRAAFEQ